MSNHARFIICAIVLLGIALRMYVATFGYNKDVYNHLRSSTVVERGGNIYRFIKGGDLYSRGDHYEWDWGPTWLYCLYFLKQISKWSGAAFGSPPGPLLPPEQLLLLELPPVGNAEYARYAISFFLTLIDIGIALLICRKFSLLAGAIFFLNPISVIITGYHSQIDNFAIFVALLSLLIYETNRFKRHKLKLFIMAAILGISMTIKHDFILFPLWLFFKEKGLSNKLLVLFLPILFFLSSFLPFIELGYDGIVQSVVMYRANYNAPIYKLLVPLILQLMIPPLLFFISAVIILGYVFRKKAAFELGIWYCVTLVLFSSAMSNHYLAIPTPFAAIYPNFFNLSYLLMGGYHLLVHRHGLRLPNYLFSDITFKGEPVMGSPYGTPSYAILLFLLLLGYIYVLFPQLPVTVYSLFRKGRCLLPKFSRSQL